MSFEKLTSFISPLCTKHTLQRGRANARFGHVKISISRFESPSLMEMIRQSLISSDHEGEMLIVSSDLEIGLGLGLGEDGPQPLAELSFPGALRVLRNNHGAGPDDPRLKWKRYVEGAQNGDVLPVDIFVVFHIDPTLPADCALALTALVEWALGVSSERESNIRVLTLCVDGDCDFLSTLIGLRAPELSVSHLDLAEDDDDPLKDARVYYTMGNRDAVEVISKSLIETPDVPKIIISFGPPDLEGDMEPLVQNYRLEERIVSSAEDTGTILKIIERRENDKLVWLTIDPALPLHPVPFVAMERSTSSDERLFQLSWARQNSAKVHVLLLEESIEPVGDPNSSQSFKICGIRRRRLLENGQLGGFIMAVAELSSWEFDVNGVLDCFIRYSLRRKIMKRRLEIQGILDRDQVALSQLEARALRSLLPLLNYDHRLALFVALDSDEIVRRVKIQLAVLVSLGLDKVVRLKLDQEIDPNSSSAKFIFGSCWGFAQDLAKQGTMWLTLGLWRGYKLSRVARHGQNSFGDLVGLDPALDNKADRLVQEVSDELVQWSYILSISGSLGLFHREASIFLREVR
ncbi:hypothetical protein NW765_011655 [Fusarium oxysporum]|nr:hypothetical protein NW765_011655 [Fusarium oxysporum]KAJ4272588.1 hypothetical protein NW764_013207 [Fusarium oxysporum]